MLRNYFGGSFRPEACSEIILEAHFAPRHAPNFFWRLISPRGMLRNFYGGSFRPEARSENFLEAVTQAEGARRRKFDFVSCLFGSLSG
jgi:hypothetical protein